MEMTRITIHEARRLCGYSLKEAAEKLGLTTDDLEQCELTPGRIPFDVALKIRSLYGKSFDELIFE